MKIVKKSYSPLLLEAFCLIISFPKCRQVAEWSKAHAWNACVGKPTESSNLFLSAIEIYM